MGRDQAIVRVEVWVVRLEQAVTMVQGFIFSCATKCIGCSACSSYRGMVSPDS